MRRLGLLLLTLTCMLPDIGQAQVRRFTADFYKVQPTKYLNKIAKVYAFAAVLSDVQLKDQSGYALIEIQTAYGNKHGGSILVAVPTDEVLAVKDKYSLRFGDGILLSGILRASSDEKPYYFIELGNGPSSQLTIVESTEEEEILPKHTDYYELLAEKSIGEKVSIQATSVMLDRSDRLTYINNSQAFVVKTTNNKLKNNCIAVVVPNGHMSLFARAFMMETKIKPRNLSGYLYKHQAKEDSFLFLYCSSEPLDLNTQDPQISQEDYLYELVAIYMDLDQIGKDELIKTARKMDTPTKGKVIKE